MTGKNNHFLEKIYVINPAVLVRAAGVSGCALLAFLFGSIAILAIGEHPLSAFGWMFRGAFGNLAQVSATLNKMSVLLLCGISCACAYKGGLINIGAEGQMIAGAVGSCTVGLLLGDTALPSVMVTALAFAAGVISGSLWGLMAGWLKVYFGASEVITTVMLNYIAVLLANYLTNGPLKDSHGEAAKTAMLETRLWLHILIADSRIHTGLLIALLAVILYGIFFKYTKAGFGVRIVGGQYEAAVHAGIAVGRIRVWTMAACGGLAGLAGCIEVFGTQHQIVSGFSGGYGFDGIAVALLGLGHPAGMILAGLLFAAMKTGGSQMQMFGGVPLAIVGVIQGLMILFVFAGPAFLRVCRHKFGALRPTADGQASQGGPESWK